MFNIKLQFIGLHTVADIQQPLRLRIRKQHWHYTLIENITAPKLQLIHEFCLPERQNEEPYFELLLVYPTCGNKAKIIGSAVINIKQWPLERAKRDRVILSEYAWLDLSIFYQYTIPATPEASRVQSQLANLQIQQKIAQVKQQNSYLKGQNWSLQQELKEISTKNRILQNQKQRLVEDHSKLQIQQNQLRSKIELDKNSINVQLQQATLTVTRLINMISEHGHIDTIIALNQMLQRQAYKKSPQSGIK